VHLVIIGHRGSGKTTIGHAVAVRLGSAFVDLDDAALSRFQNQSVVDVWQHHGERAWREAEAAALADLHLERPPDPDAPPLVIALGGGTPTIATARQTIDAVRSARTTFVVWLRVPVETIVSRLDTDPGDRPALTIAAESETDPIAHHRTLLAERAPIYAALADATIDATTPVDIATARIIDAWHAAHDRRRS